MRLARHAARADVVTKGRRIAERRSLVAADQVEPGERTACEIFGLEIIDRHLVGDGREQAADEAHVVIPGQPRDAAVAVLHFHAVRVRGEIVEQRRVGHCHPVGEARRAAAVLEIAGFVRLLRGQVGDRRGFGGKFAPVDRQHILRFGGLDRHRRDFGREEQHRRVAAGELDDELADIGVAAAKAGRQRQRHRPRPGVDGAKE